VGKTALGTCTNGQVGTAQISCVQSGSVGVWNVSSLISNCKPYCSPPCAHGGQCVSSGNCQCGVYNGFLYSGSSCQTVVECAAVIEENSYFGSVIPSVKVVSGTCLPGFVGSPTRVCKMVNGAPAYQSITNPCLAASNTCSQVSGNQVVFGPSPIGQYATGTCSVGYVPSLYGPFRFCNLNGDWAATVMGSCVQSNCAAVVDSNAYWPSALPSATIVTGTCVPGTTGAVTRLCSLVGGVATYQTISGSCS